METYLPEQLSKPTSPQLMMRMLEASPTSTHLHQLSFVSDIPTIVHQKRKGLTETYIDLIMDIILRHTLRISRWQKNIKKALRIALCFFGVLKWWRCYVSDRTHIFHQRVSVVRLAVQTPRYQTQVNQITHIEVRRDVHTTYNHINPLAFRRSNILRHQIPRLVSLGYLKRHRYACRQSGGMRME